MEALFAIGAVEISIVVAVVIAFGAFMVVRALGRQKPGFDPDAGLAENLADYPPAPAAGTHRLTFEGLPVRLRLAIIATAGKLTQINVEMAEGILQAVFHGLGEVADLDQPRIRIWPAQLSQDGFAPKFFDNVHRTERTGQPSRRIFVAGPARAGQKVILLGLALETTDLTARGNVRMDADKWTDKLRVQIV
jgi:hypothetical protein